MLDPYPPHLTPPTPIHPPYPFWVPAPHRVGHDACHLPQRLRVVQRMGHFWVGLHHLPHHWVALQGGQGGAQPAAALE